MSRWSLPAIRLRLVEHSALLLHGTQIRFVKCGGHSEALIWQLVSKTDYADSLQIFKAALKTYIEHYKKTAALFGFSVFYDRIDYLGF